MKNDRLKWNRKHQTDQGPKEPAEILRRFAGSTACGRALDIAAGTGQNSLYLAQMGFQVDAVDISDTALRKRMPHHSGITSICADLDQFVLPQNHYDLIINLRYLNRRLMPLIKEALRPQGLLIFQTFLERPHRKDHGPTNPDFLLRPNELLHAFISLHVLFYQEADLDCDQGLGLAATLVARRLY